MRSQTALPRPARPTPSLGLALGLASALGSILVARAELNLTLAGGGETDRSIASNVWLRVPEGGTPSPFVPVGPFTATWSGELSVELRGDYQFQAAFAGRFQLTINATNVLSAQARDGLTPWSNPVRLHKGTNRFEATLIRSAEDRGDTHVRLLWQGRGLAPGPIPGEALTAATEPPATISANPRRARGRALFLGLRCGRCHAVDSDTPVPELAMDAPSFLGLGSRRRLEALREAVLDPGAGRPDGSMPRLLHGPGSVEDAEAIATWLSSLRAPEPIPSPTHDPGFAPGNPAIGRSLADRLQCQACHVGPGEPAHPAKISLARVSARFVPGALPAFLQHPAEHFRWTGMPTFDLSGPEAAHLAAWLDPIARAESAPANPDPARLQRGRELVETLGCLGCHTGPTPQRARSRPLARLGPESWQRGCIAEVAPPGPTHPHYRLTAEQRLDLRAFGATDRRSLGRHVPTEFAGRWTQALRCDACHERGEGIPRLQWAGEKLRPEWTSRLLSGAVTAKPRPWLPAQMPAFPAMATLLPEGLAALHGLPPHSPPEGPIDEAAAADGRRLVSASGGFACVTCHAVGPMGASAVFEAPGVNFSVVSERLLPDFFRRWVRNPQRFEPTTKMPLYFDEDGNSALAEYADGDGPRTLHALWSYLRLGAQMPPPPP